MFEEIIHLNNKCENLFGSEFVTYQDVCSLIGVKGVYIIYEHTEEIMYVGSASDIARRFRDNFRYETSHTLSKKLINSGRFQNTVEVINYLKNQCKIRIETCESKREYEALEHIAIYILNPAYNN